MLDQNQDPQYKGEDNQATIIHRTGRA